MCIRDRNSRRHLQQPQQRVCQKHAQGREGPVSYTHLDVYKRQVCAIALAFTAVCPAVAAAPEETTGTPQTLTASEVKEMQQTDAAVTALTDSAAYAGMSEEERQVAALAQLDELAAQGLVKKDSIYVDAKNGMVSFTYSCGALGGILLTDTESEADAALPGPEMEDAPALLAAENGTVGNAVIYYAFDNGVNSNRYPYYCLLYTSRCV